MKLIVASDNDIYSASNGYHDIKDSLSEGDMVQFKTVTGHYFSAVNGGGTWLNAGKASGSGWYKGKS